METRATWATKAPLRNKWFLMAPDYLEGCTGEPNLCTLSTVDNEEAAIFERASRHCSKWPLRDPSDLTSRPCHTQMTRVDCLLCKLQGQKGHIEMPKRSHLRLRHSVKWPRFISCLSGRHLRALKRSSLPEVHTTNANSYPSSTFAVPQSHNHTKKKRLQAKNPN